LKNELKEANNFVLGEARFAHTYFSKHSIMARIIEENHALRRCSKCQMNGHYSQDCKQIKRGIKKVLDIKGNLKRLNFITKRKISNTIEAINKQPSIQNVPPINTLNDRHNPKQDEVQFIGEVSGTPVYLDRNNTFKTPQSKPKTTTQITNKLCGHINTCKQCITNLHAHVKHQNELELEVQRQKRLKLQMETRLLNQSSTDLNIQEIIKLNAKLTKVETKLKEATATIHTNLITIVNLNRLISEEKTSKEKINQEATSSTQ